MFNLVKKLLIKKNKNISIWIVLIIILFGVCCYWYRYQVNSTSTSSSLAYEKIVFNIRNSQNQDNKKMLTSVKNFAEKNKNIYGVLALLEVTQQFVKSNQLDIAVKCLKQANFIIHNSDLKAIINIRIARLQIQQKKADEALKTLNLIKEKGFSSVVSNIRGEALISKGDKQNACKVWKIGIENNNFPVLNEIMRMKINNFSV